MAIDLTTANFDKEVKQSSLPVVIDVFATWCGPCKMLAPVFEELSKEASDKYKFGKLNIDDERDLAIQFSVSSVPTLLFFKGGELVGKETGFMNKEALKAALEKHLG